MKILVANLVSQSRKTHFDYISLQILLEPNSLTYLVFVPVSLLPES